MIRRGASRPSGSRRAAALEAVVHWVASHPDVLALVLILAIGAAVRLAFFVRAPVFIHGDSFQYYAPASALLHGEGFPLSLKRPPLYPVFIALVGRGLGDELRTLIAVQHVLGLGTAALAYGVGCLTFGRWAGLIGGLASALAGGLLIMEQYVLTESLFTFVLTLAIFLALVGLRRRHLGWYAATGVVVGIAALTRPHAQVLLLLIPAVTAVHFRRWRPTLRAVVPMVAIALLILLPWMVRNKLTYGTLALSGGIGQHLVRQTAGLHAGDYLFYDPATPPKDRDPERQQVRKLVQEVADENASSPQAEKRFGNFTHREIMRGLQVDEARADALMREVALEAILARPLTYARLALSDFLRIFLGVQESFPRHWRTWEMHDDGAGPLRAMIRPPTPEQEREMATAAALVSLYQSPRLGVLLAIFFLVGLISSALLPAYRSALLPGVTLLSLHAGTAATVGFAGRYHGPPDPLLHILAAGGLLVLARMLRRHARRAVPFRLLPTSRPLSDQATDAI